MSLPAALSILGQDGNFQTLLKKGAQLPAQARAVFATQKAGQRELGFKLYEGGTHPATGESGAREGSGAGGASTAKLIGTVAVELPAGLPPNTWLAVFVDVAADLSIRIEVKENLRRIRIDADLDRTGATAGHFTK